MQEIWVKINEYLKIIIIIFLAYDFLVQIKFASTISKIIKILTIIYFCNNAY